MWLYEWRIRKSKLFIKKKEITYQEFNELIGSYYIDDYEELEDGYYILNVISPLHSLSQSNGDNYYTDFIQVIN